MDNERHALTAPVIRQVFAIMAATMRGVEFTAKASAAPFPLNCMYASQAETCFMQARMIAATPAERKPCNSGKIVEIVRTR